MKKSFITSGPGRSSQNSQYHIHPYRLATRESDLLQQRVFDSITETLNFFNHGVSFPPLQFQIACLLWV